MAVEPLPLVPVTWMLRNAPVRVGGQFHELFHRLQRKAFKMAGPSLQVDVLIQVSKGLTKTHTVSLLS